MSAEKPSYSREAYESTEENVENLASSVNESSPIDELREKSGQMEEFLAQRESMHSEAWNQASAENALRDEQASSQKEAAELLKRLRANVKAAPLEETPIETPTPGEKSVGVEMSIGGRARIFAKRLFGRELTPEENRYRFNRFGEEFTRKIAVGDLKGAISDYERLDNERFSRRATEEQFAPYHKAFKEAEARAARTGDAKAFEAILKYNLASGVSHGSTLSREELGLREGETVDPKIAQVALKHFEKLFKEVSGHSNMVGQLSDWYSSHANSLVASGLLSHEQLNEQSWVKNRLRRDVLRQVRWIANSDGISGANRPKFLENQIAKLAATGVFSRDEIERWGAVKKLEARL